MVQFTAIIVRKNTQRHKYERCHVTTKKYINVSIKDVQIYSILFSKFYFR